MTRVFAGVLLGASLAAQPATPSSEAPSALARALEAAWQRAVSAREARGQQERALADRAAASSLWAAPPSVELSYRSDRWNGDAGLRESEAVVAWPLWLPGLREARGAAAQAGVAVADEAGLAARLRLAGEVREAAWTLVARQAEIEQAEEQSRTLKSLAEDVERRVRAGDLSRADAMAARAEQLGAAAAESEARQQLRFAQAAWRTLTGFAGIALPEERPAPSGDDWRTAHPEWRAATLATEHARRRYEAALASRAEAPELKLGLRQEEPGRGELSQKSVLIGIRVPFGTADRNGPLVAAARSELDVAEAHEGQVRDRLDAQAAAARAAVEAASAQVTAERDRAALLRERARLIDRAFRAGESPLPDLLRALSSAAQAESALARQEAAHGLARARHRQALGLLP